jgi:hypothetical protein
VPLSKTTPSEELVLEVLAARYRLGHTEWPFHKSHRKTLKSLEEKKLIFTDIGSVEDSYDVSLTPDGKKATLTDGYTPPIYAFVKDEFKDAFITSI